jgi:hypothetical protein
MVPGRLVLVGVASATIAALRMPFWWLIGIVLALTSLLPERRRQVVWIAGLLWMFLMPPLNFELLHDLAPRHAAGAWLTPRVIRLVGAVGLDVNALALVGVAIVAAFAIVWSYAWATRCYPKSVIGRKPVLGLLLLLFALLAANQAPLRGLPWLLLAAVTMAFNQYIWFFAYWVAESRVLAGASQPELALRAYAWRPFWGFTTVPFGKGAAYLQRVEAKDDQQLAESQLKGLKLLGLAVLWTAVFIALKRVLFGAGGSLTAVPHLAPGGRIPTYQMALDAMTLGHPYSLLMRWAALIGYFLMWMLYFTIFGHKVIGICRVAGFNAFRNTYKPHLATSIAEFFNCIYYYFKELLVTFFFYPTYLRWFKKQPRVRVFVATLAAAGFGNFLLHYFRAEDRILRDGLWRTLQFFGPYMIYALLLGSAIGLSQLRLLARKGKQPVGVRRVFATAGVWLFFCLICIIEEPNDRHGLADYGRYFIALFVP